MPGVILAGGLAERMGGGDKGLRLLAGETLIGRVIARLAPQCGALAINANGGAARWTGFGLPVLPDTVEGAGPLGGVLAAMDWAAELGARKVVTVSCDTPFLPLDLVARLAGAARGGLAHAASGGERHRTVGLWPVELRDELRAALAAGVRKVALWTDPLGPGVAEFPAGTIDPFFNVNTPEDLAAAERHLA